MVLIWSPEHRLGITEIDNQHARLIGLIERLRLAMAGGTADLAAVGVLAELLDYTQYHFATEHRLMKQHGYAEISSHEQEHASMQDQVGGFVDQFTNGTSSLPSDLLGFLEKWLARHLHSTDRSLCEYLKTKGLS